MTIDLTPVPVCDFCLAPIAPAGEHKRKLTHEHIMIDGRRYVSDYRLCEACWTKFDAIKTWTTHCKHCGGKLATHFGGLSYHSSDCPDLPL